MLFYGHLMDIKTILAVVATLIMTLCVVPYIRDIFRGETKPHSYTWLIWALLQGIAAIDMWSGGAGFAVASSSVGALLNVFIFILSLRYGTKNITNFDTACLIGALAALGAYFYFHNAALSIAIAVLVDFLAFLPTERKTWQEPGTETASTHFLSGTANVLTLAALSTYNFVTVPYVAAIMLMDYTVWLTIVLRRKH